MDAVGEHTDIVIVAGSNLDKERCLPEAIRQLRRNSDVVVRAVSACYESPSLGGPTDAPDFFNAAILATTMLDPEQLRSTLRDIEHSLGRIRTSDPNAPRTIDLDIVYFGDLVKDFGDWSVPDPGADQQAHIAVPVADVAPRWIHPVTGMSTGEIADRVLEEGPEIAPNPAIRLSSPYTTRAVDDFDDVEGVYAPRLEDLVREQLVEIGEDPNREGLVRTPLRVAKAMDFLTSGYSTSLEEVVNGAIFDAEGASEMVVVRDVEYYSMCEHHMLPFFGKATVAYLPKGKIIGLSKIARIVDVFARRLQVQERLTNQVADAMDDILDPYGVGVIMEGKHLCMMMRGVQKQESNMVTSSMRGTFRSDARTRSEFLELSR
jgi:GTP cyclohydrolase IA